MTGVQTCALPICQNIGAKQEARANQGTRTTIFLTVSITAVIAAVLYVFAEPATGFFTRDASVIEFGALFLHTNTFFLLFNCVNHVLAGALRGRGDSQGPMFIMLIAFVAIRQAYLFIVTHFVANTARLVGFGYPVGWMSCCALEIAYYYFRWVKKEKDGALRA